MQKFSKPQQVILAIIAFTLLAKLTPAAIIEVKQDGTGDFDVIQDAIDAAIEGDEIIVYSGIYFENLQMGGKNIILRSTDPLNFPTVEATIIDARNTNRPAIDFSGAENETCKVSGLTLQNGLGQFINDSGGRGGGGLHGNRCEATIEYNIILENEATYGGGIHSCDGLIQYNEPI